MENSKRLIHSFNHTTSKQGNFNGLTKLEYFSLHLMQGLLSGADRHSQKGDCQTWNYEHLSKISISAADALLLELSKDAKSD